MLNLTKRQQDQEKKKVIKALLALGFEKSERHPSWYAKTLVERTSNAKQIQAAVRVDQNIDSYAINVWPTPTKEFSYIPLSGTLSFSSRFYPAEHVFTSLFGRLFEIGLSSGRVEARNTVATKLEEVKQTLDLII